MQVGSTLFSYIYLWFDTIDICGLIHHPKTNGRYRHKSLTSQRIYFYWQMSYLFKLLLLAALTSSFCFTTVWIVSAVYIHIVTMHMSTLNYKVIVIYDMIIYDLIHHPKTEGLYTDKLQTVRSVEIFLSFQSANAVGINKYLQFSRLCNHHFFIFFSSLPPFILSVHAGWPYWAIFADWDTFGSSLGFLEKMK